MFKKSKKALHHIYIMYNELQYIISLSYILCLTNCLKDLKLKWKKKLPFYWVVWNNIHFHKSFDPWMYNLKNIMQRAFLYLIFQRGQLVFMLKEITYKFDVLMNTNSIYWNNKKKEWKHRSLSLGNSVFISLFNVNIEIASGSSLQWRRKKSCYQPFYKGNSLVC